MPAVTAMTSFSWPIAHMLFLTYGEQFARIIKLNLNVIKYWYYFYPFLIDKASIWWLSNYISLGKPTPNIG